MADQEKITTGGWGVGGGQEEFCWQERRTFLLINAIREHKHLLYRVVSALCDCARYGLACRRHSPRNLVLARLVTPISDNSIGGGFAQIGVLEHN
jgi:hypothetical protein